MCKNGDGAGFLIVASEKIVKECGLDPIAEIIGFNNDVSTGSSRSMGIAPLLSVDKLLKKTNLSLSDIDRIEQHDPFAALAIDLYRKDSAGYCGKVLGFQKAYDSGKINKNGGSIVMYHPFATTGVRLIANACQAENYGLVMLCASGGLGGSLIVKKCK